MLTVFRFCFGYLAPGIGKNHMIGATVQGFLDALVAISLAWPGAQAGRTDEPQHQTAALHAGQGPAESSAV
jgi:hypothetical protein